MTQETRGRKRKDLPDAKVFQAMALLLESGKASSLRGAAILARKALKISSGEATENSLVDRYRKRFKDVQVEMRAWARKKLDEQKVAPPTYRPPVPPSIGVGQYYPRKR